MDQIFIGRQGIFDRTANLFGYELLYRNDELNHATFSDGHLASTHVILTTFLDIGLERIVGSSRAFINLTRDFLEGAIHLPVAPEQVVLELLEDVQPTAAVIDGLRQLVERGFTIALDDHLLHEKCEPLLQLAHIVKIDTLFRERHEIQFIVERLRRYPVKLLAEKIEDEEMLEFCRAQGFDYFQGYHLHRPQVISGKQLPNNERVIRQLLVRLQDPQVALEELEPLITLDATLSYQLLRYLNCASYGARQEIDSIQQAIHLLGLTALEQWVKLIDLKQYTREQPYELLLQGLLRARMCECLARDALDITTEQAFTVGLLSVLESLLHTPIAELLDEIPLSMPVKLAILDHYGTLGELLALSTAFEEGEWDRLHSTFLSVAHLKHCYREALLWADGRLTAIHA